MTQGIIRLEYDTLSEIVSTFGQNAEQIEQLIIRIERTYTPLANGGWQGKGAAAFSQEMEQELQPALRRFLEALQEAQAVSVQIGQIMSEAEEEAARPFRENFTTADHSGTSGQAHQNVAPGNNSTPMRGNTLFEQGSNDNHVVEANDLEQSTIGNCYLIASLGTIAQQNPDYIRNMIKDNGDGTYTIRFYKEKSSWFGLKKTMEPVDITITPDMPNTIKNEHGTIIPVVSHTSGEEEMWPQLVEKGYGKLITGSDDLETIYSALNQGGYTADALSAITGKNSQDYRPNQLSIDKLAELHDQGHPITVSSLSKGKGVKDPLYVNGFLHEGHAYWIDSIDKTTGDVILRNPWGYDESPIRLSYSTFKNSLSRVTVNDL